MKRFLVVTLAAILLTACTSPETGGSIGGAGGPINVVPPVVSTPPPGSNP